jgi:amino-acid N-acetyltransferase
MHIQPLTRTNLPEAIQLLKQNNLPTEDITEATHLFAAEEEEQLVGTVGIELLNNLALLRSLCVDERFRSTGAGNALVTHIEQYAATNGVKKMYLLTTTADRYFSKKGYTIVTRSEVPDVVKGSSQFAAVCPSTAVVMFKEIA